MKCKCIYNCHGVGATPTQREVRLEPADCFNRMFDCFVRTLMQTLGKAMKDLCLISAHLNGYTTVN